MMELLEFARGPALTFAITIFIAGTVFRIASLVFMWRAKDSSEGSPRETSAFVAAIKEIARRMWPLPAYKQRTLFMLINGYVFHLGLAIIVFLLLPHILFFKDLVGLSWGHLPNNVIYAVSIVTMISLIAALVMRLSNPAQRIISTFDDYASWFVTFLPVLTGYMAYHHLFFEYTMALAIHILTVELLLIAFPFTKLMHAITLFISRWYNGYIAGQKGVQQ